MGDGETDVRSARNAGLRCLAVTWGFRSRESLEREAPDALADRPEELPEILESLG